MPQRYKLFSFPPNFSPTFCQTNGQRTLFAAALKPIPDYYDENTKQVGLSLVHRIAGQLPVTCPSLEKLDDMQLPFNWHFIPIKYPEPGEYIGLKQKKTPPLKDDGMGPDVFTTE